MARKRDLKNQRFWLGTVVLAVILIFGILLTLLFSHIHHPLAQQLREAATAAQAENWGKATALARSARAEWEQYRYLISASADHEPLEQMEYLLDQLEVYTADRQKADFAALCIRLANLAEAMADTQQIRWWNLL